MQEYISNNVIMEDIMIHESILDSDHNESLVNKYLLTISRSILYFLRKNRIAKKNSISIRKETLVAFLRTIGYKNHSTKYINNLLYNFERSSYVKGFDPQYIALKGKFDYEQREKNYFSYTVNMKERNHKFTFTTFKQEAIEFLYSRPNIIENTTVMNYSGFINFTSQLAIASCLNIDQSVVSTRTKNFGKIYALKLVNPGKGTKTWGSAVKLLNECNQHAVGRYMIMTVYEKDIISHYNILKIDGSKLAKKNDNLINYKLNKKSSPLRGRIKTSYKKKANFQQITSVTDKSIILDGSKTVKVCKNILHEGRNTLGELGTDYYYLYSNELNVSKSNINFYSHVTNKKSKNKLKMIKKRNVMCVSNFYNHKDFLKDYSKIQKRISELIKTNKNINIDDEIELSL